MRSHIQTTKTPKNKTASSQSPLYKKKLFKFVNQNVNPQEQSMQVQSKNEQPAPVKTSSKVVDFKQEIERRFQRAVGNREYVFPRRASLDSISDSSFSSMTNVVQYDLHTQNFKKEIPKKTIQETVPPAKSQSKFVNPKSMDLYSHFHQKLESKKILNVKDDILEDSSGMMASIDLKMEDKPRVESPSKNLFDKKLLVRSETPTSTTTIKSNSRLSKGNKNNTTSEDSRRLQQKAIKTEPTESSFELRQSNSALSTKNPLRTSTNANSKTINVSLHLNLTNQNGQNSKDLSPQIVSPQDKKSFVNINNYGTVNNIINYNIYSTMQPAKSTKDLRVNVSVPMKSSITSTSKPGYHSTKNSDALNNMMTSNHVTKPSSASTTDKSLQSFKSSLHSEAEKVYRNNYVTPKASNNNHTKASGSTSRLDTLSTSREASKSQERKKPTTTTTTSALYQKTQNDLLKKMKMTETQRDQISLQTLTYFPQTTRNLSKNSPKTPSTIKLQSPRISNILATSSNLKTANKMMSNSVKMLTSSSKNLHAVVNKTPTAREPHGVVNKTPTQRERPETKSTSANKSHGDLKTTQYPHLKKLLENNEQRISLIKSDKPKNEKQAMRLDLRSITKTSGLYTERNPVIPIRSDRKDKSSSEYY